MAKEKYPVGVVLKLLTEVAQRYNEEGFTRKISERLMKKYNLEVGVDYFYNDYTVLKYKNLEITIERPKENLDVLAKEVDCENFDQYLSKIGYRVPEKDKTRKRIFLTTEALPSEFLLKRNPPHTREWLDKYTIGAQIMPAFLGVFPLLITLALIMPEYKPEADTYFIFGIIIGFGLVIALSGWLAIVGKRWENRIFFFNRNKGFPTTYLMLFSTKSKYSEAQKQEYRDKVATCFGILFPAQEEEITDETTAIQKLHQAGMKVKNVIESARIRSAQIKYGFHRNLIPASVLGMVMAIPGAAYGVWKGNLSLIGCMAWCFAAGLYYYLFHNKWVKMASEAYARYLIDEFLSR